MPRDCDHPEVSDVFDWWGHQFGTCTNLDCLSSVNVYRPDGTRRKVRENPVEDRPDMLETATSET